MLPPGLPPGAGPGGPPMGMHKNGGRVAYKTGGKVKKADGGDVPMSADDAMNMMGQVKIHKNDTPSTGRAMGGKAPVKMTDGAGGGLGRLEKVRKYGK